MRTEWIWIPADDSEAILYPIIGPEKGLEKMKWMQDMIGGYYTTYPCNTEDLLWIGAFSHPQFSIDDISRFDKNFNGLWCDEDGIPKGLPLNKRATSVIGKTVLGNVLIELNNPDWDEEKQGVWVDTTDGPALAKEEE